MNNGNGYEAGGLYAVTGWTKNGQVVISGPGWREGVDFTCNVQGIEETIKLSPTWTPVRPTATATAEPTARPTLAPTATPRPLPGLTFYCEDTSTKGGGHLVNRTGVTLGVRAGAYYAPLGPGGSLWLNPAGADVFTVTSPAYATLTVDISACKGGVIVP